MRLPAVRPVYQRCHAAVARACGRDPLVPAALAAGLGIGIADRFPTGYSLAIPGLIAALCFALALWRPRLPGSLLLGTMSVYAFAHAVNLWTVGQFPLAPNLRSGETMRVVAEARVVEAPPTARESGPGGGRGVVRITGLTLAGHHWRCDQRLPITLGNPQVSLKYGDRIVAEGRIRPFGPPLSPGAFDPAAFHFRKLGALGEFVVGPGDPVTIVARDEGYRLIAWAQQSRQFIADAITRGLEDHPDESAVIKAMVLGSREQTPDHIEEAFQLSGAMHVFSVSGLHVAIFGSVIWVLLRTFRVSRRAAALVLIPSILFYATVTGLPASAVRAAVMGSIVFLSPLVERQPRLLNSLGLAGLAILAYDTQQLYQAGFQLSFAVLAAMAIGAGPAQSLFYEPCRVDPFLPRRLIPRWRRVIDRIADWLTKSLGVSVAAWAGSAILIVHHFQIITPVAVVANVIMVPAAFVVLATAIGSLIATLVGGGLLAGVAINPLNALFARILTLLAIFFASVPGGTVHVASRDEAGPKDADSTRLTLWQPNIGGLSQLISSPRANGDEVHWLIDPGDPGGFTRAGQPVLRHDGINRLQALVLTHGDHDHIGSAPALISRLRPAAVLDTPFDSRSSTYPKILDAIARAGSQHLRLARGDYLPIGADSDLTVLYPPRQEDPASLADDRCLVLRLRHGSWRILLTSDSGFLTEKWLLERSPEELKADVWIKGWHASDRSGLAEFLERVDPAAVITTHQDFPLSQSIAPAWRDHLAKRGTSLVDLSESGSVTLTLDRDQLVIEPQADGAPPMVLKRPP